MALKDWFGSKKSKKSQKFDVYQNSFTGIGTTRDKATYTNFIANPRIPDTVLEALYHNNDLAARICEAIPEDSLRQGYCILVNGQEEVTDDLKNAEDNPIATEIIMKLDELCAREKVIEAAVWANVFGAGILYCGINDGKEQDQPVDETRIRSIDFITVLDRRDLTPFTWYEDPSSEKYGKPETYKLNLYGNQFQTDVTIHESRLIIFEGTRTSRRVRVQNNYWPDSKLQKVEEVLTQFNQTFQSVSHLMTDAAQGVFKMKGVIEMMSAGDPSWVQGRLAQMDMNRSIARTLVVDAESGEDFKRDTYSFNGIQPLIDRFMLRLAAAARMPIMILMGQSPGGLNSTGSEEIRWYYDTVKSFQKYNIKPALEKLISWCMLAKDGPTKGIELENWSVTFPSLWQLSDSEKAEIEKTEAETRKINAEAAVLEGGNSPEMAKITPNNEPNIQENVPNLVQNEADIPEDSANYDSISPLQQAEIDKINAETAKILAEISLLKEINE